MFIKGTKGLTRHISMAYREHLTADQVLQLCYHRKWSEADVEALGSQKIDMVKVSTPLELFSSKVKRMKAKEALT